MNKMASKKSKNFPKRIRFMKSHVLMGDACLSRRNQMINSENGIDSHLNLRPNDENLFEQANIQWKSGDWESLVEIDRDTLQHHPNSAKLALLVAAGHLQLGRVCIARQFIRLAQDLGCSKKLISQILISGAYNSLGCAAALFGQKQRGMAHLEKAVAIGIPGGDVQLLTQVRISELKKKHKLIDFDGGNYQLKLEPGNKYEIDLSAAKLLVDKCFANKEIVEVLESVNTYLLTSSLTKEMRFDFCCMLALRFHAQKDNLTAVHFLNSASGFVEENGSLAKSQFGLLSKLALEIRQAELSIDFMVRSQTSDPVFTDAEKQRFTKAYRNIRATSKQKQQHGHDLLLSYLKNTQKSFASADKKPVLIEIGTTREIVPGQGSTRLLAELCKSVKIHFITVDMDPNNSQLANAMFAQMGVPFEAITMKGEDYLQSYPGKFDFIFLDAYDFDHGKHSVLRQSRYFKYLGRHIDEEQCHQMHLDCAKSVLDKLTHNGVVCIDDTWQDKEGNWTAKGKLAIPFLLENGLCLIEARNRAVLLKRI
jgi:tetratricopeptide (TPR) repeat protein